MAAALPAPTPAAKAGAKPAARKRLNSRDSGSDPKKVKPGMSPADKENANTIKQAQAMKALYHRVCAVHSSRMKSMKEDPRWADLANDTVLAKLTALSEDVLAFSSDTFVDDFLTYEWNDVKKKYVKDMGTLHFKLQEVLNNLKPKVEALDKEHARLNRMVIAGAGS